MNHITVVAHGAPNSLVRNIQENPQIALDFRYAVEDAIRAIPDPLNATRMRLQAAVDLFALGHTPRRPLAERLEREAAVVGAGLDAESIEQAGELA